MARPKRLQHATGEATSTPPDELAAGHQIARIEKAAGNNLYSAVLASNVQVLVEMPARFRSTIWVKRGTFVVVDTTALADRDNKLGGEIVNVVRDERKWMKQSYWPSEFCKIQTDDDDDSDEESTVGKMPPSDSDGDT